VAEEYDGAMNYHCVYWAEISGSVFDLFYFRNDPITDININTSQKPGKLSLSVYPNPFNSIVSIEFTNPGGGDVDLNIYNLLGQEIVSFSFLDETAGKVNWNATDKYGQEMPSGLYFIKLNTSNTISGSTVVYIK